MYAFQENSTAYVFKLQKNSLKVHLHSFLIHSGLLDHMFKLLFLYLTWTVFQSLLCLQINLIPSILVLQFFNLLFLLSIWLTKSLLLIFKLIVVIYHLIIFVSFAIKPRLQLSIFQFQYQVFLIQLKVFLAKYDLYMVILLKLQL